MQFWLSYNLQFTTGRQLKQGILTPPKKKSQYQMKYHQESGFKQIYSYSNHHLRELMLVRGIMSFHEWKVGCGTKNTNLLQKSVSYTETGGQAKLVGHLYQLNK